MDVTVSMPLDRFKQLESAELAIQMMKRSDKFYAHFNSYSRYPEFIFPTKEDLIAELVGQRDEAIKRRDETIAKVRAFEEKTKQKVF